MEEKCNGLQHLFHSKIIYDSSNFRALSTIHKIINRWMVTRYINNFNRNISQYFTNSKTDISSCSLYRWVIRWTLDAMNICDVFILMHPVELYSVIKKWKYTVQHNTIETCNTMWYDIKVLCWTAYFLLFISCKFIMYKLVRSVDG
jgi:hypothetical protein